MASAALLQGGHGTRFRPISVDRQSRSECPLPRIPVVPAVPRPHGRPVQLTRVRQPAHGALAGMSLTRDESSRSSNSRHPLSGALCRRSYRDRPLIDAYAFGGIGASGLGEGGEVEDGG